MKPGTWDSAYGHAARVDGSPSVGGHGSEHLRQSSEQKQIEIPSFMKLSCWEEIDKSVECRHSPWSWWNEVFQ